MTSKSKIASFFSNQTVFLTGGSGFLGKLIIDKLLRNCPNLEKIYVLIRPKRGKTPEERFQEIFSFACFDLLKERNPEALDKVFLVNGDCQLPNLGLAEQDIEILTRETNCVIHAAANVKFDQSLREAAFNVRATRDLLEIAKKMENLKVFVFVSTAFANCIRDPIEEKFYEPPMLPEALFSLVDIFDDRVLEKITPQLLSKYPNNYIFCKNIAEYLIWSNSKDLPLTVVRPSIVASTFKEPVPGWVDNLYGVVGLTLGAALGAIKTINCSPNDTAEIVPADYVINCILAATVKRAQTSSTTIYNFVNDKSNQISWGFYMSFIEMFKWCAASPKLVMWYTLSLDKSKIIHKLKVFFLHTTLGYIADFFLWCVGRPTLAVKNYKRLNKMLAMLSYFSNKEWNFKNDNVKELWEEQDDADKKLFPFNMLTVDWHLYIFECIYGGRKFLLKENLGTLEKGRRKMLYLMVAHYVFLVLFYYLIYKFLAFCFRTVF